MTRILLSLLIVASAAHAETSSYELGLHQAETQALKASNQMKSYVYEEQAATQGADAQFTNLLPKLSLTANYTYYGAIPNISLGPQTIPFGTHNTYSAGPNLSYTLWDSFSGRRTYEAASLLASARAEDRKSAELQLLASVRSAYVQVQLGLEELELISETLDLSRAQQKDVGVRYHAGAADKLDVVTADRSVGTYEIQFKQRQAELGTELRELLNLVGGHIDDISRPGPEGVPGVSLVLRLDPLDKSLAEASSQTIAAPGDDHPQVRSLLLQAQSSEKAADSQSAKLLPQIQVAGGVARVLPDVPNPPEFWQETVGVTLTVPLWLGDPTPKLAAEQRSHAQAAEYRRAQLKEDIHRDYDKSRELLDSLKDQKKLAAQNVDLSERAAKLYYLSYRAGKVNLIDVQNANVQSLQSKVDAARIDAQILNQIILLKSISGKEAPRG